VNMPVLPLSVIGLGAVMYMLYIFANLSRRLGQVTKMRPYYRAFYVAIGFLTIPALARILFGNLALATGATQNMFDIPFLIAMALSVVVAWRYWSWLLKEKLR
jgi:uncharacterized membrane protein